MMISKDLLIVEKNSKYLAYNYEWNDVLLISKQLKDDIEDESISNILKRLSNEEVTTLINHGLIMKDKDQYEKKKYKYTLESMNTEVHIDCVYFHLTQRCNLHCTYCYNKANLNKPDLLSTDEVKDIITQLRELGVQKIVYTGGEVLLRKDIEEICEYTHHLGIKCDVLSNGMLLNKRMRLLPFVETFIISLDTLIPEHNLRLGLNTNRLIANLQEVPQEYKQKFSIRSVSSIPHHEDWKDVKGFVETQLGMSHIVVPFLPNCQEDMRYVPNLLSYPIKADCNFGTTKCAAAYRIIAIDSNGDIYPCQCLIKPKYFIGNVKEPGWFQRLKDNVITTEFRKRDLNQIQGCRECKLKYLCGGGCPAISDNLYGTINNSPTVVCALQKRIAMRKLENLIDAYG